MENEKVKKALELCYSVPPETKKCGECPYYDMLRCSEQMHVDALELIQKQEELIKAMQTDLESIRSCKACANYADCSPDAPPESPEFKIWRDCGGSCKLNWEWRGVQAKEGG